MYAALERRPGGKKFLKVGFHSGQAFGDPDSVPRHVENSEKKEARLRMEDRLARNLSDPAAEVCLYAMTKGKDIPLVGPVPGYEKHIPVDLWWRQLRQTRDCSRESPDRAHAVTTPSSHDLERVLALIS